MLPSLVSLYNTLQTITTALNASKAQKIALDTMEAGLREKNLAELTQEQVLEEARNLIKQQGVQVTEEEIVARLTAMGVLKADTAAKGADTAATGDLTAAQNALNASMLANPIT